jgi:hypothetical protein
MTPRTETRELTEHERLSLVKDKSQAIGDFVEWMGHKGISLCHVRHGEYIPVYAPITKLLAEYFDIDENKLEREKRQILAEIRKGRAAEEIDKELGL